MLVAVAIGSDNTPDGSNTAVGSLYRSLYTARVKSPLESDFHSVVSSASRLSTPCALFWPLTIPSAEAHSSDETGLI